MKERNVQLDFLKIIMSISVIGVHTTVFLNPFINNLFHNGFLRIAVPTFLIINGFYLSNCICSLDGVKKLVHRLFILYGVWWVIYFPFCYTRFDFVTITNGTSAQLWYLPHLAIAVILLYLLKKILTDGQILIIAIGLFLIGYCLQTLKTFNYDFPFAILSKVSVSRNFLFFSFPFLVIGHNISKYSIWDKLQNFKLLFVLIGLLLLICETVIFYLNNKYFSQDLYLGLLLISPFLFLYFKDKPKERVVDDFYSKLYIAIYLTHFIAIEFTKRVFGDIENPTMQFILILLFTLMISTIIINLDKRIKFFL